MGSPEINSCIYSQLWASTHGHHQMVNTEIRLIIFFAAKDGEALYSQQKQDRAKQKKLFRKQFTGCQGLGLAVSINE